MLNQFEGQLSTRQTMGKNQAKMAGMIACLQERLNLATVNGGLHESERLRLQEDINRSKECLEVWKAGNQASSRKTHIIGDVIGEDDCDQVVVTDLSDLFNTGKLYAKSRSMQLVGSMPVDALLE
jgi:hypothetical protein